MIFFLLSNARHLGPTIVTSDDGSSLERKRVRFGQTILFLAKNSHSGLKIGIGNDDEECMRGG